jgi:hypothetical protein
VTGKKTETDRRTFTPLWDSVWKGGRWGNWGDWGDWGDWESSLYVPASSILSCENDGASLNQSLRGPTGDISWIPMPMLHTSPSFFPLFPRML